MYKSRMSEKQIKKEGRTNEVLGTYVRSGMNEKEVKKLGSGELRETITREWERYNAFVEGCVCEYKCSELW